MNHIRKQKLIWISLSLVGFGLVIGLVLYALKEQTDYYYDPSSIVAGNAPQNKRIRAGGMVVAGSVRRNEQNPLKVSFRITDFQAEVPVVYEGILPDLFKENSGIVAQGKLANHVFVATQVLAKHDENYMPPEVKKSLKDTYKN